MALIIVLLALLALVGLYLAAAAFTAACAREFIDAVNDDRDR